MELWLLFIRFAAGRDDVLNLGVLLKPDLFFLGVLRVLCGEAFGILGVSISYSSRTIADTAK
jgi:hypothetical protein